MKAHAKHNITLLNSISSLILQLCLIASNFIIPKLILGAFGSEVNGLISSITQFLNYITLVEGGITGVVMASLYKPLLLRDNEKISSILKTASKFYRRIGLIFIAYTVILATVYPLVFNTTFSFLYVFSLTLILSISLLIQYTAALSIRTLLMADKKVFVVSTVQILITILSILTTYLSIKIYPNIHLLKLLTGILYIAQPFIFKLYTKNKYQIQKTVKEDKELLANRWSSFAVNMAAFIHNSTDIVILTIFTDFQTVSIYSVYTLVTMGLRSIIQSISKAITPSIGHSLARGNKEKINADFDSFEFIILALVFAIFSVASMLITPFAVIYTSGINDANYNQPIFGILILLSEVCYLIREHHVSLAYSMNKFREITLPCFIEATINIIISIILVKWLGIIGVAIGTIVAMCYRSIYHVFFTKKLIGRPVRRFLKNIIFFGTASLISIVFCQMVPAVNPTIKSWLLHALVYSTITGAVFFVTIFIFYKKELQKIRKIIKKIEVATIRK